MKAVSGEFFGTYAGRVVETSDPIQLGRIKARVPILHGFQGGEQGLIEDSDLPWALPTNLPAGGSPESGGVSWIPVVGDQVWIRFLDGELDKPIWEWGNQNVNQVKQFGELPIHEYDKKGIPFRRAAFSRYYHWFELLPTGYDLWTKSGYHFEAYDEQTPGQPSGRLTWTTALGFIHSLDDATQTLTSSATNIERICESESTSASSSVETTTPLLGLNIGSLELGGAYSNFQLDATKRTVRGLKVTLNDLGVDVTQSVLWRCNSFMITNGAISFDSTSNNASTTSDIGFGVSGDRVTMGYGASDPLIRLSDLVAVLRQIKLEFDTHQHANSGGNGVGGTPTVPARYQVAGSNRIFAETSSHSPVTTV